MVYSSASFHESELHHGLFIHQAGTFIFTLEGGGNISERRTIKQDPLQAVITLSKQTNTHY